MAHSTVLFSRVRENSVMDFLKSSEFTTRIEDIISNQMKKILENGVKLDDKISFLSTELAGLKKEVKLLRQINEELKRKIENIVETGSDDSSSSSSSSTNKSISESDEEIPQKKGTGPRVIGTVRWFNAKDGYGFITKKDSKQELFVHKSAITRKNPKKSRSLKNGETVEFNIIKTEKGLEAVNVTGPDGKPVEGSDFDNTTRNKRGKRNRHRQNSNQDTNQSKDSDNESRSSRVSSRSSSKQSNKSSNEYRKKKNVNNLEDVRPICPYIPFTKTYSRFPPFGAFQYPEHPPPGYNDNYRH